MQWLPEELIVLISVAHSVGLAFPEDYERHVTVWETITVWYNKQGFLKELEPRKTSQIKSKLYSMKTKYVEWRKHCIYKREQQEALAEGREVDESSYNKENAERNSLYDFFEMDTVTQKVRDLFKIYWLFPRIVPSISIEKSEKYVSKIHEELKKVQSTSTSQSSKRKRLESATTSSKKWASLFSTFSEMSVSNDPDLSFTQKCSNLLVDLKERGLITLNELYSVADLVSCCNCHRTILWSMPSDEATASWCSEVHRRGMQGIKLVCTKPNSDFASVSSCMEELRKLYHSKEITLEQLIKFSFNLTKPCFIVTFLTMKPEDRLGFIQFKALQA